MICSHYRGDKEAERKQQETMLAHCQSEIHCKYIKTHLMFPKRKQNLLEKGKFKNRNVLSVPALTI